MGQFWMKITALSGDAEKNLGYQEVVQQTTTRV